MISRNEFIGGMIKKAREEEGLSQKQLAGLIGFESGTAISLIESGKRKVAIEDLELIAKVLHRDIKYFLGQQEQIDFRLALRASNDLTAKDKEKILDFIDFVKTNNARRKS
ncbi:MAG: helix-turn-helix domain-containing protein [Actinobacteria bacterium]|nr:MAG: helix-turn-helix domain-containing protein [Actinomycetota bacterium]